VRRDSFRAKVNKREKTEIGRKHKLDDCIHYVKLVSYYHDHDDTLTLISSAVSVPIIIIIMD